jgi:hypothetical protein
MSWQRLRAQWSKESIRPASFQIALVTSIVLKLAGVIT